MFNTTQWEQAADFVLPVILGEGMKGITHHYWRLVEMGIRAEHFPPGIARETYRAAGSIISAGTPAHISAIEQELNGIGNKERLPLWVAMYGDKPTTLGGDVFKRNATTLRSLGEQARLIEIAKTLADEFQSSADIQATINSAITRLSLSGNEAIVGETATALASDIDAALQSQSDNMRTGIGLLDVWLGGIPRGQLTAIVAPMKQRKTTLLLNIILNLLRAGKSVTLLMFEANRTVISFQMVAMLATEYARACGWHTMESGQLMAISGGNLYREGKNYTQNGKRYTDAVNHGKAEYAKFGSRLRIYDRKPAHGGLSDMDSIRRLLLRDKAVYNDIDFAALDHAQRITVPGAKSDYEKMNVVAPEIEAFTREQNMTFCLLGQLGVGQADGSKGYASGVRGGTQLDEAVDTMLTVGYRVKDGSGYPAPDSELQITMLHNRYGEGGRHKSAVIDIDAASGLILNGGKYRPVERGQS